MIVKVIEESGGTSCNLCSVKKMQNFAVTDSFAAVVNTLSLNSHSNVKCHCLLQ